MYIYRLAHTLGDAGHHVDVIHCVDSYRLQHPANPEINFPSHPNVKVHSLNSWYKWLSPLLTHQTGRLGLKARRVHEIVNSTAYDVLHFHNMSLIGAQALTLNPKGDRAVKIYMTHEHWLMCHGLLAEA